MAIPKAEINAVIAAMTDPELPEDATNEDVATAIIVALSSVRDLSKRFVAVSQQRLHIEDEWSTFAVGPFNTEKQASGAGEGMSGRPGAQGYGHWKVGVLLPTAAQTWKVLTEIERDKNDRFGWAKKFTKDIPSEEWNEHEGRGSW